jgi:hypothetical protein
LVGEVALLYAVVRSSIFSKSSMNDFSAFLRVYIQQAEKGRVWMIA